VAVARTDDTRRLKGLLARVVRMPDPLIRPTAHDLVFRRYVSGAAATTRWLNVGSGERQPLTMPNVVNLDVTRGPFVHVIGDAHVLPFHDEIFDGVVCRAVLEHLREPWRACSEIFRVLRPGGIVLVTVPFLYPYHGHPDDYRRFTAAGIRVLLDGFEEIECGIGRLPTAAMLSTMSAYAATFSDNWIMSAFLRWIVAWLLNPLKYLDHYLKHKKNARLLSSYYFLGRKPVRGIDSIPKSA
jgi:SAM-dependent methyltransferase